MSRLREKYEKEVAPLLKQKFNYKSVMEIPKIEKVVVNMGVSDAVSEPKALDAAMEDLKAITGQKPAVMRAKKSIAAFKLRKGIPIGCKVTLRGERMYYFLDKLFNAALPRIRDFRGVSPKGFDGRGNYTLGIKEQLIFPEIVYDKIDKIRGMDITLVTTAKTDEESYELLKAMGMPFRAE
ncbi:MAG TPA: 50S ribosomal protein L5 [Firmicutes bacterium]|nr:50S ribosomal protein L5 [Bacillota bacterium]